MKLRTGFVSNSSSASFVVHAALHKQPFLELILNEAGYGIFMRASFQSELKEARIKEVAFHDELVADKTDDSKTWLPSMIESSIARVKRIDELLAFIESAHTHTEVLEEQLGYNGLQLSETEEGMTSVGGWTSMWNGMDDAGPLIPLIISILKLRKIPHVFDVSDE